MLATFILIPTLYSIPDELPPPKCTPRELEAGLACCALIDRKAIPSYMTRAQAEKKCVRALKCRLWLGIDYGDSEP